MRAGWPNLNTDRRGVGAKSAYQRGRENPRETEAVMEAGWKSTMKENGSRASRQAAWRDSRSNIGHVPLTSCRLSRWVPFVAAYKFQQPSDHASSGKSRVDPEYALVLLDHKH